MLSKKHAKKPKARAEQTYANTYSEHNDDSELSDQDDDKRKPAGAVAQTLPGNYFYPRY
jgi:hypothetical protein